MNAGNAKAQPIILLVDDEDRFRNTLSKRLLERSMIVQAVSSGEDALGFLAEGEADIVVLDVKMPGLDGLETLAEIKKQHPQVEVILLSGHATIDTAIEGMRLGAYDYLMKPCNVDELLDKIQEAFEVTTNRGQGSRRTDKPKNGDGGSSQEDS